MRIDEKNGQIILSEVRNEDLQNGEFRFPENVTSIGNGAFRDCTGLTDIKIPASVASIGEGAFSGCTGLTDITIPGSVTNIDSHAFVGCTGLTSVTIPDTININHSKKRDAC